MFEQDIARIERKLIPAVNKAIQVLKDDIDSKTPEDTKTLLWNNRINPASVSWNVVVASVENDTEYAQFVEFGVWWRPFNYNKPKGNIFFRWTWARMFTRARDEKDTEIRGILDQALS